MKIYHIIYKLNLITPKYRISQCDLITKNNNFDMNNKKIRILFGFYFKNVTWIQLGLVSLSHMKMCIG